MRPKLPEKAVMTTVRATPDYISRLDMLSARRREHKADLIRQALDEKFPFLNAPDAVFFAVLDGENQQVTASDNNAPTEEA